ncbi:hypothetical protein IC235_20720 [Hymenobacter sp. BT664]|uniref:Uncharacterized protein n=1 Tax=Hymenobacter montanus TaxID=2771359 RepID=A0A927GL61_9BACT|nr:hypothetical protein [Hymenobacter montanus]MBD2770318.1 hypothetical protein [Hymenobacter montanus]
MKTKRVPFSYGWRPVLAFLLLLLASWPSMAQDPLFSNPSFEGVAPPAIGSYAFGWNSCTYSYEPYPYIFPNDTRVYNNRKGTRIAPSHGAAYVGMYAGGEYSASCYHRLKVSLLAGRTYTFLMDVAYGSKFRNDYDYDESPNIQGPVTLRINSSSSDCYRITNPTVLWSKSIPPSRTGWQTETVTITPTTNVGYLQFQVTGTTSNPYTEGAVLIDNVRTVSLGGTVLLDKNGRNQPPGKQFNLLWQPILAAGELDSLGQTQRRGTVTLASGGGMILPPALQVTDARGFYFLQEATPAGQDTAYYGFHVRNTVAANGAKDDLLRDLYQDNKDYGSQQAGLLTGLTFPLNINSLRELPLPKELRLASRPAPQAVLAPYEQFTGGSLTDFQGGGLAFTPSGSWRISNGQATTGTYTSSDYSELISPAFRLDTTLVNRGDALMGFAIYFDEQYRFESRYDKGLVQLQYQSPNGSWSPWILLSQRTGQSPGTGQRTTYLSLRDPALWHKQVRLKFSLSCDFSIQFGGWTIDNVTVRQIVTTPQIRTAFATTEPGVPGTGVRPRIRPGERLTPPINGFERWVVPALERLQQNACRLDVTFVVNGAYLSPNAFYQDLPQLVNNNLDQLAQLLQGARQTSCKRVRFVVAGGQQSVRPAGTPYSYDVVGAPPASNAHLNLGQTDLLQLKDAVLSKLAYTAWQNTVQPQNGAVILQDYLQRRYGAEPEPGVKRVVVVLNNSDDFDDALFNVPTSRPRVTPQALQAQLQASGVTLVVNNPPQLNRPYSLGVPGPLRATATLNYQDRDPKYMLLDLAAAGACTPQDETCDPTLVLQKADGTAQAAGKAFRLLWQPILSVGGLDSLARPQLRDTVTTFRGGRVPLPATLQVTDSKGFYFYQEASPATGQDTLYYGLYVRNTPLANGAKDDTLRHLYQCRRTFGSQAGLLGGSLAPLAFGNPPAAAAPRAASARTARPAAVLTSRPPTAPRRPAAPRLGPPPARPAWRPRAR